MHENTPASRPASWIEERLPLILIILFVLQPLMDILSFWTDRLGMSNLLTLALRFGVLIGFALLGFCVSRKKWAYVLFALACAVLMAGHIYACTRVGYLNPITDLTNFVRVVQMPLFVFCFISCLKRNRRCYRALEKGCVINFWIIAVSLALAVITNTSGSTYEESGYGVIGWYATTNAQSAVLSVLVPIVLTLSYRRRSFPLFVLTAIVSAAQLYFIGTRLAFLTIMVAVFGLLIITLVSKNFQKKYFVVLFVLVALAIGTVKLSPMYHNQMRYNQAMSSKQGDAEVMIARKAEEDDVDFSKLSLKEKVPYLRIIYRYYNKQLCKRFTVYRVMDAYDYSTRISDITAVRRKKIIFCELLMREHPPISRVFGMELERMSFHDFTYDVENDFHGIYFLYGGAGLAMMLAFLFWFLYHIFRALLRNFRQFFTIEAGAIGMSLCMALIYPAKTFP